MKTDLERFVELYASFGIHCKVRNGESGSEIILSEGVDFPECPDDLTKSEKFGGYMDFFTSVEFDKNGKFVSQGFWE